MCSWPARAQLDSYQHHVLVVTPSSLDQTHIEPYSLSTYTMSSYLRSWFPTSLAPAPPIATIDAEDADSQTTPTNITVDLPEEEDDVAPSFPALDSAQRASSSRTLDVPRILGDSALMPPPPVPAPIRNPLGTPSPSGGGLLPPSTTTKNPTLSPAQKKRQKVALAPGHSPLDWANLKKSGEDLRVRRLRAR